MITHTPLDCPYTRSCSSFGFPVQDDEPPIDSQPIPGLDCHRFCAHQQHLYDYRMEPELRVRDIISYDIWSDYDVFGRMFLNEYGVDGHTSQAEWDRLRHLFPELDQWGFVYGFETESESDVEEIPANVEDVVIQDARAEDIIVEEEKEEETKANEEDEDMKEFEKLTDVVCQDWLAMHGALPNLEELLDRIEDMRRFKEGEREFVIDRFPPLLPDVAETAVEQHKDTFTLPTMAGVMEMLRHAAEEIHSTYLKMSTYTKDYNNLGLYPQSCVIPTPTEHEFRYMWDVRYPSYLKMFGAYPLGRDEGIMYVTQYIDPTEPRTPPNHSHWGSSVGKLWICVMLAADLKYHFAFASLEAIAMESFEFMLLLIPIAFLIQIMDILIITTFLLTIMLLMPLVDFCTLMRDIGPTMQEFDTFFWELLRSTITVVCIAAMETLLLKRPCKAGSFKTSMMLHAKVNLDYPERALIDLKGRTRRENWISFIALTGIYLLDVGIEELEKRWGVWGV